MKRRILAILLTALLLAGVLPTASAAQTKLVALTFDDGPGYYTERLLDGLKERDVRATFFCLGSLAERSPDLIRRMVAEGHQLANHSYDHPNLNELSTSGALYQLSRTDQIFNEITGGSETYYVRPPYGNTTQAIRSQMTAPVVIWSVDTIDWQLLNAAAVEKKILADTFDGSIVLMHDIHRTTVDAILSALDTLIERGYEFVTVKELCRRRGVSAAPGVPLYDVRANGMDTGVLRTPEVEAWGPAEAMEITLTSPDGAPIYYTLDGSDITYDSELYTQPITVRLPCTLRAVAAWDLNGDRSRELQQVYTLPPAGEPEVLVERGRLTFRAASEEETVYVALEDDDVYLEGEPWQQITVSPGSWFSYYAGGEGLMPTEARRLLFTRCGNLFSDVELSDWFYAAMDHCAARGYIQGAGNYTMNPNGTVTRGMLATLLYRCANAEQAQREQPFIDVLPEAYYADAVAWGYEAGIFSGVGEGRFAPDRPVTRQELAKTLAAYLNLEPHGLPGYTDQDRIASWAQDAVSAVSAAGLMEGSGGEFDPTGTATRAQLAVILLRIDLLEK